MQAEPQQQNHSSLDQEVRVLSEVPQIDPNEHLQHFSYNLIIKTQPQIFSLGHLIVRETQHQQ